LEKNFVHHTNEKIDESIEILKKNGLKVSSLAGGLMKCLPPSENPEPTEKTSVYRNWKNNFSLFPRMLELAEKYETRYIRCFGFHGPWNVPPVNQWKDWNIYQEWTETLNNFKEQARKKGKMLICENEGGLDKSLEHIGYLGKNHADDGFGMIYDMANVANKYGLNGVLNQEKLRELSPYIQFIHAKGSKRSLFGKYHTTLVNAKGDICNWPEVVAFFKDMKPEAWKTTPPDPLFLSIETHAGPRKRWEKSSTSLKNLQNLL
jgi:sugar phosphate isomerase/epimerase